jgi:ArsR family transcriptional regulator, arsenate/arsenite/antimonite-responsive transcriptional repressor / arsenate reductase (thioredoxin)
MQALSIVPPSAHFHQSSLMYPVGRRSVGRVDDSVHALQVLAEPRRWRLVAELARSDRRVSELTETLGESQNLVSYHLRELRAAGLVSARRSSFDGRDRYYRVDLARCREVLRTAGGDLHPGLVLDVGPASPFRSARGRVLFLCTGNSARSQVAEALLRARSAGSVDARSAGSHPKPLHPLAVEVMAERGIDLSSHAPKPLGQYLRIRFDRVVTLCDRVREVCPEFPGHPRSSHWSVADPAVERGTDAQRRAGFERLADELDERVGFLLTQLTTSQGGSRA